MAIRPNADAVDDVAVAIARANGEPLTLEQIAASSGWSSGVVLRSVHWLTGKGFVTRERVRSSRPAYIYRVIVWRNMTD